jgi:uncharacterized protein (TIGR03000 family)
MVPLRFTFGLTAVLAAGLLALPAPAHAQPWPYTYTSPYTSVGPVASGPLSGYTGKFPTPLPPSATVTTFGNPPSATMTTYYGGVPAAGVGRYYYSPTAYEAYSPVLEARSGIFMTTLNYPGLYGSYFGSVPALAYSTRPSASNFYTAGETTVLPPRTVTLTPTVRALPEAEPAATPNTTARLNVLLPTEAKLYVQGVPMTLRGSYREFVSPPLIPGEDYSYNLRAIWNENGKEVARDQVLRVRPGETYSVDMTRAPTAAAEPATTTLRARPLPQPQPQPQP